MNSFSASGKNAGGPASVQLKTPLPAMEKAMRFLDRRWYGEAELCRKLIQAGYSGKESRETVAECVRLGLVNDRQLTADYVESLAQSGKGIRRIRLALKQHGLDGEAAAEPLAAAAAGEPERAITALQNFLPRMARETDRRKRREKAFRFLAGRGFAADSVYAALNAVNLDPPSPADPPEA